MALPSFFKRKDAAAAPAGEAGAVQQARISARRRLIGAAVLLAVGVIAFPLLFETQPRPIPVDIPIEIPRKDGTAPLSVPPRPAARVGSAAAAVVGAHAVAEPPSPAPAVVAPAAAPAPEAPASRPSPASAPVAAKASKPAPSPAPAPKPPVASVPAAPVASAPAAQRFVVQVGAFADATAARDVRQKVEQLGLKTYTQVIDTDGGKRTRVRLGPYESNDEAVKVLNRLKAAKLPGAVLTL